MLKSSKIICATLIISFVINLVGLRNVLAGESNKTTFHPPQIQTTEEANIPKQAVEDEPGWFSQHKWKIILGLAAAGGAAAAGGGGSGGSGGDTGEAGDVTVTW